MKKRILFSIACALILLVVFGVILVNSSWLQNKRHRSFFKKAMARYNISVEDTVFELTDYYYETPLTEWWAYYGVRFVDEVPKLPFNSTEYNEDLDELSALWVKETERGLRKQNPDAGMIWQSGANLKTKTLYLEGSNNRRYLIIIYDEQRNLYHFIEVVE